jgi:hypothetical protein
MKEVRIYHHGVDRHAVDLWAGTLKMGVQEWQGSLQQEAPVLSLEVARMCQSDPFDGYVVDELFRIFFATISFYLSLGVDGHQWVDLCSHNRGFFRTTHTVIALVQCASRPDGLTGGSQGRHQNSPPEHSRRPGPARPRLKHFRSRHKADGGRFTVIAMGLKAMLEIDKDFRDFARECGSRAEGSGDFHVPYAPHRHFLERRVRERFPDLAEAKLYFIECRSFRDPQQEPSRVHSGLHPDNFVPIAAHRHFLLFMEEGYKFFDECVSYDM